MKVKKIMQLLEPFEDYEVVADCEIQDDNVTKYVCKSLQDIYISHMTNSIVLHFE